MTNTLEVVANMVNSNQWVLSIPLESEKFNADWSRLAFQCLAVGFLMRWVKRALYFIIRRLQGRVSGE